MNVVNMNTDGIVRLLLCDGLHLWVSTCGPPPLWGSNSPFAGVAYQIPDIRFALQFITVANYGYEVAME